MFAEMSVNSLLVSLSCFPFLQGVMLKERGRGDRRGLTAWWRRRRKGKKDQA